MVQFIRCRKLLRIFRALSVPIYLYARKLCRDAPRLRQTEIIPHQLWTRIFGIGSANFDTVTERRMSNSLKKFTAGAVTGRSMMNAQFLEPNLSLKVVSKYKYEA